MQSSLTALFISMTLILSAPVANAASISHTADIVGSNFRVFTGSQIPVPPDQVLLNYSISFDNSTDIAPTEVGLTINSFSLNLPDPMVFTYSASSDSLIMGPGAGLNSCRFGQNGFCMFVKDVTTSPRISTFGFSASPNGLTTVWVGSAAATFSPSAVPVPAAAWLFGSALLGLGALKRKKA